MADDSPVIQSDTIPPPPSDPSTLSSSDTNSSLDSQRPELKQMVDENPADLSVEAAAKVDESKQAVSGDSPSGEVQRPESSIPADSAIDISSFPLEQSVSFEASSSASVTTPPNETNQTNESNASATPTGSQRPIPLEMADENKLPISEATSAAEIQRPDSSILADENKDASPSAQLEEKPIESTEPESQPQQAEASSLQTSSETAATNVADQPFEPQAAAENSPEKPPEIISTADEIDVQPPDNQAIQVQSEPSESASRNDTDQVTSPSASFIPEPLEQPQDVPISNIDSQNLGKKSFGDLLSKENSSPSIPLTSPKSPLPVDLSTESPKPFSFGELLKDVKANIPQDLFEIKDTPQETVTPSQPPPSQATPTSPPLPQSPLPSEAPAKEGVSPQPFEPKVIENPVEKIVEQAVKVVDEQEVQRLYEQRLKERQQEIRERGRIVKAQKRDTRFDKILIFAQQNHSFDNQDIRDLLHISQSAVSVYLSELVKDGKLIREGKSKYITYHLP